KPYLPRSEISDGPDVPMTRIGPDNAVGSLVGVPITRSPDLAPCHPPNPALHLPTLNRLLWIDYRFPVGVIGLTLGNTARRPVNKKQRGNKPRSRCKEFVRTRVGDKWDHVVGPRKEVPMKGQFCSVRVGVFVVAVTLGLIFTVPAQGQFICGGST